MQGNTPITITAYVKASNERDSETFTSLFTSDAVVHDEGKEIRGIDAIQNWFASTTAKYNFTFAPIDFAEDGADAILTIKISGDFPGSPLNAKFRLTLESDKITKLRIH